MIRAFVLAFAGRAAAVLLVYFEVAYEPFEVLLRHRPIILGRFVLVFPHRHLCLIKVVAGVVISRRR